MYNSNNQQNKKSERGDCQSVIEKTIAEMRTLLKIMVEALKAQPNIKNTIKKGLPRIVDQLEELESAVKSELQTAQQAARLFTPARRRAMSTTAAEGTPTEPVRDKKRGASSSPSGGHFGVNKTLQKIRQRFYWASCKKDVENWCRSCSVCISKKGPSDKGHNQMRIYNVGLPFERVQVDIFGPFPISSLGNRYLLVVTDC